MQVPLRSPKLYTESLKSPERQDNEYDRKIVLFAMLASDLLIINNEGDQIMTSSFDKSAKIWDVITSQCINTLISIG